MTRDAIFTTSIEHFLAPIAPFLGDESVSEIMVNRFDQIYIERAGRILPTDARFASEDALETAVRNVAQFVGRMVDAQHPILDGRLPDGSRVHAILPPACRHGVCLTIRKFKPGGVTLGELIQTSGLSESAREFLELSVRLRKNILIAGGTGTGKTSLLGALSAAVPEEERIVVIEDTSELKLAQRHTIYLEAQPPDQFGRGGLTQRELFVASLRMRPDRIIMGEVRGGEALDMIQAMLSGHSGSLSTVHATTVRDALVRLETLSLMSDVELPVYVARTQVASAIDLVVQLERFPADGSRRVTRIAEVDELSTDGQFVVRDLYVCHVTGPRVDGRLQAALIHTGEKPSFASAPYQQGLDDYIAASQALWTE